MKNYTEPNFRSSAVITIDTQCDTLDGQPFQIPGTSTALPKIKIILDTYRQKRMPIVHIARIYKPEYIKRMAAMLTYAGKKRLRMGHKRYWKVVLDVN